ncbi:MAG: transposase [Halioglobus sp.]|nr:transposase [Halioglobus sp.]
MARLRRYCPLGVPQHVIQRGNNRSACFAENRDMAAYARFLLEAAVKHSLSIHGWVFMTNHVHLLVTPEGDHSVSRSMQSLGRRYVRYFNHKYQRTGTLFEGRFKSCIIQESAYFLACLRYIELNPVRAGIVKDPADYVWSSYRANGLGHSIQLWSPHRQYMALGSSNIERQKRYRALFESHVDEKLLADIRQSVNQGLALGSEKFRREIEQLGGRRQRLLKRGPR